MLPALSPLLSSQPAPANHMDYAHLSTGYAAGLRSPAISGLGYNSLLLPSLMIPGGYPVTWPYLLPAPDTQADLRTTFFASPFSLHHPSFPATNSNAQRAHILSSSGHLTLPEPQPKATNQETLDSLNASLVPSISVQPPAHPTADPSAAVLQSAQAMDMLANAAIWDLNRPSERLKRQNSELNDASSSSTADGDSDSEGEEHMPLAKRRCPTPGELSRYSGANAMMLQPPQLPTLLTLPRTVGSGPQPALHALTAPNLPYALPYIVPPLKSALRAMSHGQMEHQVPITPSNACSSSIGTPPRGSHVPLPSEPSSSTSKRDSQREWAFRHATSDWAKYNWHVRSGGRYIMTERAYRRYFACDHPGCPAVLYEDSPVEPKTGEAIRGGEMRMTLQKEHNHSHPDFSKPCNELVLRAAFLLKSMSPAQVRDQLIVEAGNGIGIPSIELIKQIADKHRFVRKDKR